MSSSSPTAPRSRFLNRCSNGYGGADPDDDDDDDESFSFLLSNHGEDTNIADNTTRPFASNISSSRKRSRSSSLSGSVWEKRSSLAGKSLEKLRSDKEGRQQRCVQAQKQEDHINATIIDPAPTTKTHISHAATAAASKRSLHDSLNDIDTPSERPSTRDVQTQSIRGENSEERGVVGTTLQESTVTSRKSNTGSSNSQRETIGTINSKGPEMAARERGPIGLVPTASVIDTNIESERIMPTPSSTTSKLGETVSKSPEDNVLWSILQNQWPILNGVVSTIHDTLMGLVIPPSVPALAESDKGDKSEDKNNLAGSTHPINADVRGTEQDLLALYDEQRNSLCLSLKEIETATSKMMTRRSQEQGAVSEILRRCLDEELHRRSMLEVQLEEATRLNHSLQSQREERDRQEVSTLASNAKVKALIKGNLRSISRKNKTFATRTNEIDILRQENEALQLQLGTMRRRRDEGGNRNGDARNRTASAVTSNSGHDCTVRGKGVARLGGSPVGYVSSRQARRRMKEEQSIKTFERGGGPFSNDKTRGEPDQPSELRSTTVSAAGWKRHRKRLRLIESVGNPP